MPSALQLMVRWGLALRRPWLGRRLKHVVIERAGQHTIVVLPQVFNPVLFRTGAYFASQLPSLLQGKVARALDMGTGTGIGAIAVAPHCGSVIALDINPQAVRCARINVLLNNYEDKIDVRQSDLFEGLAADHRFDLVLFNPPFYRGAPASDYDKAWRSPDGLERFADGLDRHLAPDGRALIILSTDGESDSALRALCRARFDTTAVRHKNFGNEICTIYSVSR